MKTPRKCRACPAHEHNPQRCKGCCYPDFRLEYYLSPAEHVRYLRENLIPDLLESGRDCTACDFRAAADYLEAFLRAAGVEIETKKGRRR